ERAQARMLQRRLPPPLEKLHVLRVGPGPAAFDVVDAEGVQPLRDADFVVGGKRDAFPLRAVSKRRVEQLDALSHGPSTPYCGVAKPQMRCCLSNAAILSSCCSVIPNSSIHPSRQLRPTGSISNENVRSSSSVTVHWSKSIVSSYTGVASVLRKTSSTCTSGSRTGKIPFLKHLL